MTRTAKLRLTVAAFVVMPLVAWLALYDGKGKNRRGDPESTSARPASSSPTSVATEPLDAVKPPCWRVSGTVVEGLRVWRDPEVHFDGNASAALFASNPVAGQASLDQTTSAVSWRGQRVEFAAEVRTRGADSGARLWVRVYEAGGTIVAVDNGATTHDGVYGDQDWTTAQIVIDVPESAETISYGVFLVGKGAVWIDNARIAAVSNDVPVTGPARQIPAAPGRAIPPDDLVVAPTNMGFEDIDPAEAGCAAR